MDSRRIANLNGAQPQFTRVVNANTANTQRILSTLDTSNKQSVQAISRILQMNISDLISNTDRKNVRLVDLILGRTASLMDETVSRLSSNQLAALKADIISSIQASSTGRLTTADKADIIKTLTTYFDNKTNLAELKAGIAQLGIVASDQNTRVADVKATVLNSSQQLLAGVNDAISRLNQTLASYNFGSLLKNQQLILNSIVGIQQQNMQTLAQLDTINTMQLGKMLQDMGIGKFFSNSFDMIGDWWNGEDSIRQKDVQQLLGKKDIDWMQDIVDNAATQIIDKLNSIGEMIVDLNPSQLNGYGRFDSSGYQRISNRPFRSNEKPPDGFMGWISKPFEKLSDLLYSTVTGHERIYSVDSKALSDEEREAIKKSQQGFYNGNTVSKTEVAKGVAKAIQNVGVTPDFIENVQDSLDLILLTLKKGSRLRELEANEQRRQQLVAKTNIRFDKLKPSSKVVQPAKQKNAGIKANASSNDNWFGDRTWAQSFKNFFKAVGNVFEWLGADDGGQKFWKHWDLEALPSVVKKVDKLLSGFDGFDLSKMLSGFDVGGALNKVVEALIKPNEEGQLPLMDLLNLFGGLDGLGTSKFFSKIIGQVFSDENIDKISKALIDDKKIETLSKWLWEGRTDNELNLAQEPLLFELLQSIARNPNGLMNGSGQSEYGQKIASKFVDTLLNSKDRDYIKDILNAALNVVNMTKWFSDIDGNKIFKILEGFIEGQGPDGQGSIFSDFKLDDETKNTLAKKFALGVGDAAGDIISALLKRSNDVVDVFLKPAGNSKNLSDSPFAKLMSNIFSNQDQPASQTSSSTITTSSSPTLWQSLTADEKKKVALPFMLSLAANAPTIVDELLKHIDPVISILTEKDKDGNSPMGNMLLSFISQPQTLSKDAKKTADDIEFDKLKHKVMMDIVEKSFTETNVQKIANALMTDKNITTIVDTIFNSKDKDSKTLIQNMVEKGLNSNDGNERGLLTNLFIGKQTSKLVDALAKNIEKFDMTHVLEHTIDKIFDPNSKAKIVSGQKTYETTLGQYIVTKLLNGNSQSNSTITNAFAAKIEKLDVNSLAKYLIDSVVNSKYDDKQTVTQHIADIIVGKINQISEGQPSGNNTLDKFLDRKIQGETTVLMYIVDKAVPALVETIQKTILESTVKTGKDGDNSFADKLIEKLNSEQVNLNGQKMSVTAALAFAVLDKITSEKFVNDVLKNLFQTDGSDAVQKFFDTQLPAGIEFKGGLLPGLKTKTMAAKILETFVKKVGEIHATSVMTDAMRQAISSGQLKVTIDATKAIEESGGFKEAIAKAIVDEFGADAKSNQNSMKESIEKLQAVAQKIEADYLQLEKDTANASEKESIKFNLLLNNSQQKIDPAADINRAK